MLFVVVVAVVDDGVGESSTFPTIGVEGCTKVRSRTIPVKRFGSKSKGDIFGFGGDVEE